MLDFKTHAQLVEATASVMRWYTLAAINASAASASHSLSLWSEMLDLAAPSSATNDRAKPLSNPSWAWAGAGAPWWAKPPGWSAWSRGPLPAWNGWLAQATSASSKTGNVAARRAEPDPGAASYRSAGGHAVAQVIVGPANRHDNGRPRSAEPR